MAESILIIEDEEDIALLIQLSLQMEGYDCHVASRGDDALEVAQQLRPDLVLLDLMLPGIDGVEVCRQLRKDPRTSSVAIIMLTAKTLPGDRVAGLEAGADDYVDKPFDVDELLARVFTSLRRGRVLRATSPLTGLPGNFEIERRLEQSVASAEPFALMHVDLDSFKAYNDRYGFVQGDRAIMWTAQVLVGAAESVGDGAFVGHIGGDDFAVLGGIDTIDPLAEEIIGRFDEGVEDLYDPDDWTRGYVELLDRRGRPVRHRFLSVSIGVASSEVRPFTSSTEAAALAVELKAYAKAVEGSAWRIDRRRGS